ncbi:MAG: magnesium transporter CorA family protein [Bacillota bacterium]|nr:magnesium transporter CorA family protein [Bacillota bacterium]
MLAVYKSSNEVFTKLDNPEDNVWINLVHPTPAEIEQVSSFYGIPADFIKAPLDEEERSRLDSDDGYHLILVDVPIVGETSRTSMFTTIPFAIIVGERCIVTTCIQALPMLDDFILGRVKGFVTGKKSRFILQLLNKNATYFLNYLRLIDRRSSAVEMELHKSMKNQELIQLLDLEKSLVYFSTSLKANEVVLEKLLRMEFIRRYPEDEELLEDVIIENKQAIEMANIYSNILSGTMDAFASIISNNLNIVMKFLTSVTIVMAIPTMIASFYGMNVKLPLMDHPYAYLFILMFSIFVMVLVALFMARRKMF